MKMESNKQLIWAIFFGLVSASAMAGEYNFGTGAEYTQGDYGTSNDTSALYVPFTLGYDADAYGWSLTVPYLSVTGTGDFTYSRTGIRQSTQSSSTSTGSGPGGGSTSTKERTVSGLGDVTLSATYRPLPGGKGKTSLGVTAKVKFATADENEGLGTGENDYSLEVSVGKGAVYGYAGYMLIGDTALTDYNDIGYGGLGLSVPAGNWTIGGEYYAEQSVLDGFDPVSKLTLSAGRDAGKDNWTKLYVIKGFSDSSPDWGVGIGFTHYF